MAEVIKAVSKPHDCYRELQDDLADCELWLGSVVECSCGQQFIRAENQRDGLYWRLKEGK